MPLPDINRLQSRAPNLKAFYAQELSSFPTTIITVPDNSEYAISVWNVVYAGSDLGTETLTFQIVTKAGTAVTLGTASIVHGDWVEFLSDGTQLQVPAGWGLRLNCTANITAAIVVTGTDNRFPQ